jgi:hypothetical protein
MVLAIYGVNGNVDYFATAAKQSQHIHEFLVLATQARPDDFRMLAILAQGFDGLAKRNRLVVVNCGALFRSCKARVVAGGLGRHGGKAHIAEQ